MGVGVHQHIRRSVSGGALNGLHIAAGDHQLVGCTGMPQTVEHDTRELRVRILPFEELLADQHRLHRQTVRQTEQHSTVMVACRVFPLVCRQLIQPLPSFSAEVMKMVRQEEAVLVLFRMREVVLRSSLSGNTLMMQPSST